MKIAIFGGTFNPVHNEHVNIVKSAKSALKPDKILVVPSYITPLKTGAITASGKERIEMCRLAFCGIDGVEVSDTEIESGGVSYSYLTCEKIKKLYSGAEIYFIIGADSLAGFHLWKYPERILNCVTLAVCARESEDKLNSAVKEYKKRFDKKFVIIPYVGKKVSSTNVRISCAADEDISLSVPESVCEYIRSNGLYKSEYAEEVKKYLTEERYAHTLRVVKLALKNAKRLGLDEQSVLTAAILHDCAKYIKSGKELEGFVFPKNVPPPVMHQYTGAYVAEHTFNIKDENILNAIKYHTSGRADMSDLEKLIFLADMLEEGRSFEGAEELRKLFYEDVNKCLYSALKHQIDYLASQKTEIYPLTLQAYQYLKEKGYDE